MFQQPTCYVVKHSFRNEHFLCNIQDIYNFPGDSIMGPLSKLLGLGSKLIGQFGSYYLKLELAQSLLESGGRIIFDRSSPRKY